MPGADLNRAVCRSGGYSDGVSIRWTPKRRAELLARVRRGLALPSRKMLQVKADRSHVRVLDGGRAVATDRPKLSEPIEDKGVVAD